MSLYDLLDLVLPYQILERWSTWSHLKAFSFFDTEGQGRTRDRIGQARIGGQRKEHTGWDSFSFASPVLPLMTLTQS